MVLGKTNLCIVRNSISIVNGIIKVIDKPAIGVWIKIDTAGLSKWKK